MKARSLALAALAALVTACGGGESDTQAGDTANPGATGTIDNTGPQTGSTPVDTMTATDATTAGANGSAGQADPNAAPAATPTTPPNAPPATAAPATMGDTAHGAGH